MPRILLCLLLLALAPGLSAADGDLYSGSVTVEGQGEAERNARLPAALLHVLRKLSGQRELERTEALERALAGAKGLATAFQYLEVERMQPDGTTTGELRLVVNFRPEAVDRLVRELGLPRWRTERKPVVIWPVLDSGEGRELMPLEYGYAWDRLEQEAALRGLPIAWPALSEELKAEIDLQLLWGGYAEQLMHNPAQSDGVVIVAARREGPEWNLRWTFTDERAAYDWRTRDRELLNALVEGLHQLGDRVAALHSIGPAGLGNWQVELQVANLQGREDYASCLAYLQGLGLVDRVTVKRASPDGVRFQLELNAAPEYLERALTTGGRLGAGAARDAWQWLR